VNQDQAISYTLAVLCGDNYECMRRHIEYGNTEVLHNDQRLVIEPSGFFEKLYLNTRVSVPALPLAEIQGVPIIFGRPCVKRNVSQDGIERIFIKADIIASAFFLLTRYEEIVRREIRDEHGRFPGRESLPFRAGFLHRPIVDEYGALLRKWLREVGVEVSEPPPKIKRIFLTHDVDRPWAWRTFRSSVKATFAKVYRNPVQAFNPMLCYFGLLYNRDPYDCFDWILEQDTSLRDTYGLEIVESVFFFLAAGTDPKDRRCYLKDRRIEHLFRRIEHKRGKIGLHSSYSAGKSPERIAVEKGQLEKAAHVAVRWNRHHYLTSREPEHLAVLESAGITDDFTMGYADVAGFRLGTCHPVRWFDPVSLRLTKLTLHPMTIMECTLDHHEYMNLGYVDARRICFDLLEQVKKHHGEAVLLWHNTRLSGHNRHDYQKQLYVDILQFLMTKHIERKQFQINLTQSNFETKY